MILDEYGELLSAQEMIERIEKREWKRKENISADYLEQNNATYDEPSGLLRHKIGFLCVENGPGTYDYMDGEFS